MKPLGFGQVLDYTFRTFGRRFKILFPLTLLLWGLFVFVLELVNVQTLFMDEETDLTIEFVLFLVIGLFLIFIGYVFTKPILDSSIAHVTLKQFDGQPVQSISEALQGIKSKIGKVIATHLIMLLFISIGFMFLMGIGILIMVVFFGVLDSGIGANLSVEENILATIAFFFLILLFLIILSIPLVYLHIRFSLIIPIVVAEDTAFFNAFGRSWELTRSSFWRIFGLYFILRILIGVVNGALSMLITLVSLVLMVANITSLSGQWLIGIVVALFTSALACIPYSLDPILFTLIYMDRRATREGEDIRAKLEQWKKEHTPSGPQVEGEVPSV